MLHLPWGKPGKPKFLFMPNNIIVRVSNELAFLLPLKWLFQRQVPGLQPLIVSCLL